MFGEDLNIMYIVQLNNHLKSIENGKETND